MMNTALRKLILTICAMLLLAGPLNAFAESVRCEALFADDDQPVNQMWSPFKMSRHGIPSAGKRVQKPLDKLDVRLMMNSFLNKRGGQPVESGVVEILDEKGTVIYESSVITGDVGQINLNGHISSALNWAAQNPAASALRYRHSHPPPLSGSPLKYGANSWKFSQGDRNVNANVRKVMDGIPEMRRLDLIATIVYLDPGLNNFSTNVDTFTRNGYTKAYVLPSPDKGFFSF